MDDGLAVAVIAGLVVGIALIVLFALVFLPYLDIDDNVQRVEYQTDYNHENIPDLHLIVKKDGKRYAGEEGSYCWDSVCADYGEIIPKFTIVIEKGSEIKFEFVNFSMPETFGVTINTVPFLGGCRTDNVTGQTSCGLPEGIIASDLTRLSNDYEYNVDVPQGLYTVAAGGNWQENDASYYYRVQVRE